MIGRLDNTRGSAALYPIRELATSGHGRSPEIRDRPWSPALHGTRSVEDVPPRMAEPTVGNGTTSPPSGATPRTRGSLIDVRAPESLAEGRAALVEAGDYWRGQSANAIDMVNVAEQDNADVPRRRYATSMRRPSGRGPGRNWGWQPWTSAHIVP